MDEDVKKPFWKKWWFWGIVIVVLIAIGSGGDNGDQNTGTADNNQSTPVMSNNVSEVEKDNAFKPGEYKVGSDIPAGEYVLIDTGGGSYFQVSSDSSGSLESIVANDMFSSRSIISISDGQYLQLKNCKAYPVIEAPAVTTDGGILTNGMYKVGTDFPAGEYKAESVSSDGYIEVSNDSTHGLNSIATNDIFQGSKYVTVSDGQYVKLQGVKLYVNK